MIADFAVPNIINMSPQDQGISPYIQYLKFHAYQIAQETVEIKI